MRWNGKELATVADLARTVYAIAERGCRADAEAFMAAYRAESPHADANVFYLAGFWGRPTAVAIWDWFGCARPVVGTSFPTLEETLAAGMRWPAVRGAGRPAWSGTIGPDETGRTFRVPSGYARCRQKVAQRGCTQPPVADMDRGPNPRTGRPYWYAYCAEHLAHYGRRVEDGRVVYVGTEADADADER